MKRILLSVATVVFMSSITFAQNIPTDPSVRIGTLSNGMKYYIKKKHITKEKSRIQIGN